jgi:hypothetical protein
LLRIFLSSVRSLRLVTRERWVTVSGRTFLRLSGGVKVSIASSLGSFPKTGRGETIGIL